MKSFVLLLGWFALASAIKEPSPEIIKIIGGFSGSGHTTHYWDCCVPACSYPINMSVVTHGVVYCLADGTTKVTDYTGTPECTSPPGTTYTCNDNQPWIVNSTLAYGYTAASFQDNGRKFKTVLALRTYWTNQYGSKTGKFGDTWFTPSSRLIKGGVETDDCCKCVLLSFQGTLAGKQYLAQITNTGSDLTQNHFDIQIPGGGVGIFNGCQRQWNAGADGWGERYGGVTSEEQCSILPGVLQEGCRFRWTFLNGVENPDVTFQQVQCPAELIQRTGCQNVNDN